MDEGLKNEKALYLHVCLRNLILKRLESPMQEKQMKDTKLDPFKKEAEKIFFERTSTVVMRFAFGRSCLLGLGDEGKPSSSLGKASYWWFVREKSFGRSSHFSSWRIFFCTVKNRRSKTRESFIKGSELCVTNRLSQIIIILKKCASLSA